MNKRIVIVILSILTLALGTTRAFAADITITCDGTNPCVMEPAPQAALFNEAEFPLYDLKPGDNLTRKITVTNEGNETCQFTFDKATITNQNPSTFGNQLFTVLKNGSTNLFGTSNGSEASNNKNLNDLLATTNLPLGPVNSGESETFDWTVTFDKQAGNEYQKARLVFDFDMTFSCGEVTAPELIISKTNNRLGQILSPGADILYTLFVTVEDDPLDDVFVIDLPPEGFDYRGGSWTAISDKRGDLKSLAITTEPTYASPGTWQLGDMEAGETVTLTYMADIDPNQESGTYPDLAWARGTSGPLTITAQAVNPGFVDDNFAGTKVQIAVGGSVPQTSFNSGSVLGAATELPETGANFKWTLLAAGLVLVGSSAIKVGKKLQQHS